MHPMISEEDHEHYRKMGQEGRFRLFRQLMRFAWESLLELPDDERARRLAWAQRQHAEGNARLEAKFRSLP